MNDDINNKSGALQSLYSTVACQQIEISGKNNQIINLKQIIEKMTESKKRREQLL